MKLTKLLMGAVLAVAAMAFVACEPDQPADKPAKEYAFELKSETTMEFPAEGGEGVIEWALNEVTRYEPVPEALPTFYTEAAWITLDAENLGAFAVAANEDEAREAVINIEYKEQKFTVTVKQAAPAPAPVEATELAVAARIPSAEFGLENNVFVLAFADDAESLELGIVLVGEEGTEVLAAGVYNVDNEGLVAEECALQVYTEEGLEEYFFESGEVVVAVDGENYDFDITLATTEGEELRFTYEGVVVDMVPEVKPAEPVAFTPAAVKAELYEAGNFFLQLYIDDARYHELDMYDVVAPNEDYLSAGLYSYAAETIGSWSTFNRGNDQTCGLAEAEITLAHNDDNTTTITGFIKSEEGDHITIDWTGVIEGMNLAGGDELPFYNFTSAEVCWWSSWADFQILFKDANGIELTCNFWNCAEMNFLPEGEYWVGNGAGMVYTESYSYIDLNDGGPFQDLQGGKVIVAEVDGKYQFTFEGIYYGSDFDNLQQFNGSFTGLIETMILPSEYVAPDTEDLVAEELTITSHATIYNMNNEHEIGFYYAEGKFVDIDFWANPITAGTYTLLDGLNGSYCKSHGSSMVECTAVVTENSDGTLTFDVTFVVTVDGELQKFHFTYTADIYA